MSSFKSPCCVLISLWCTLLVVHTSHAYFIQNQSRPAKIHSIVVVAPAESRVGHQEHVKVEKVPQETNNNSDGVTNEGVGAEEDGDFGHILFGNITGLMISALVLCIILVGLLIFLIRD